MRARLRAPRGQSVVELALGVLLFVTVVFVGIHFAEVGYLSLKVHEAAVSPLWDGTALRVHKIQHHPNHIGRFDYFNHIPDTLKHDAQNRYEDFDGLDTTTDGGWIGKKKKWKKKWKKKKPTITQLFTRVGGMKVECAREDTVEFDVPRSQRPALLAPVPGGGPPTTPPGQNLGNPNDSVLDGVYENVGGVSCWAEAQLETLPTLPRNFLDDESNGGFFSEPQAKYLKMKVCAGARAGGGGNCQGRYGILLGDFAFHDAEVSEHCPLQPEDPDKACPENEAFYYAARKVFKAAGGSAGHAASDFAKFFVGHDPIDEDGFFMSYRGEEDDYVEQDTPPGEADDETDRPRNTGGVPHEPVPVRRDFNECFLGQKC